MYAAYDYMEKKAIPFFSKVAILIPSRTPLNRNIDEMQLKN